MSRLLLALALALPLPAFGQGADEVVDWSSPAGVARLEASKHKAAFFALANQFESQTNKAFCGPTSATIVLNALRNNKAPDTKPEDPTLLQADDRTFLPKGLDPLYHRYTQGTFFSAEAATVKSRAEVLGKPRVGANPDFGIQLRQLDAMLKQHGLASELRIVGDKTDAAAAKAELIRSLSEAGVFVLVNFHRPALGQQGGGHISPLGAYDDATDSFLVMDVNPNAAPWVWVKASALVRAMRTKDVTENRGYLVLRDK